MNSKFHIKLVTGLLVLSLLIISMIESILGVSLRLFITGVFVYYLCICFGFNGFILTRGTLRYIVFLLFYSFSFFLISSGNNLIIHLLTISFGVVFLYGAMMRIKIDIELTWSRVLIFWRFIYFTLVIELVLVFLGYQNFFYNLFPESNRIFGLPAYRSLYNSFTNYFELDFDGLNSITLQAQAYGQFCVMLTILSFQHAKKNTSDNKFFSFIFKLVVPLLIFSVSPNITATIVFIFILIYVVAMRYYIGQYSLSKLLCMSGLMLFLFGYYYFADLGFIRRYESDKIYDLFLGAQLDYIFNINTIDLLFGVGLEEYYEVAPAFEIAILSYLCVSGMVFGLVNLYLILKFSIRSLKQIKCAVDNNENHNIAEIQSTNLLFMLSMLLSAIHFPVITSYLGSAIFIFHFSFGLYILRMNSYSSYFKSKLSKL